MHSSLLHPRDWGVGTKITAFSIALVGALLATLLLLINLSTTDMLEQRSKANVANVLSGVHTTLEVFSSAVSNEAASFARIFASEFDGPFTLDSDNPVAIGGKPVPALISAGKVLNLDFTLPDRFTAHTGVVATVFAASGEEFIRITTSLKKENGERAVGTQLDHAHPSYQLLRNGARYTGLATLFG
ncbi:MAG: Cache 3/Cache 2 fusion domain-containing protein, partial [Sphingomonadaceae bacterium]